MDAIWLVNGSETKVDPSDRGLAYGDGLFETMLCRDGSIRWLDRHIARLISGARRLALPTPPRDDLAREIREACPPRGSHVVKLILTRGSGARGYAPPEPARATRILSIARWQGPPAADYTRGIRVTVCALRLGENPQLAGLKHLCRLEQVLAQMELTGTGAQEGLVRSQAGFVIGGISSNVFAVQGDRLLTPRVDRCGVAGVMRRVVLEQARHAALVPAEADLTLDALLASDELLVTNAVFGIKPVQCVDRRTYPMGPATQRLMQTIRDDPGA